MMIASTTRTSTSHYNRLPQPIGGTMALLSVLLAALLGGCARGVATTTVQPNGSWVRTVSYHGTKVDSNGGGGVMGTPIKEAFVLPTGANWKITHEDTKDEAVIVAQCTLQPGEVLRGDITVKGSKDHPMPVAVNVVTVERTAPGVLKYTETIHWTGPVPKNLSPDGEMLAAFKKALPPTLATDANAHDLASESIRDLWVVLFGPGDPLLSQLSSLMTEPELVERRVQQRIGVTLEKHIEAKFGTQMTPAQRRATAAAIIHNSLFDITSQTKNAGPGGDPTSKPSDDTPGASLFVEVKLPGRITATNGERDDVNGDVFWALYPEAAAIGDVTLTATCDTNGAAP